MRYLDLNSSFSRKRKKNSRLRFVKLFFLFSLFLAIFYVGYLFFWPTSLVIKQVFEAPRAALSFFRGGEEALKSTHGRTNILILGLDKRSDEPRTYKDRNGNVYKP